MKRFLRLRNLLWLALIPLAIAAIRFFPWDDIFAALRSLTLVEIGVLILLNSLILLLFSARWWFILRAYQAPIPYIRLSGFRLAGFAISYFTPGTQFGGEPLQVYLVNKHHRVPTTTAIASVTLDKLFEIIANFAFMVTGVVLIVQNGLIPGLASPNAAAWIAALLALPLAYFGLLRFGRLPLTVLLRLAPRRLSDYPAFPKIAGILILSEEQIAILVRRRPWLILGITLISGLVWVLMILEYWLMVGFLGAPLTPLQAIAGLTASRLAFLTPLPGGVGVLEASQVLAMEAFGYTAALGITISLVMRARDLIIGLVSFWLGAAATGKIAGQPPAPGLPPDPRVLPTGD